ncbi:hypothetical protein ACIQMP_02955 [Streptomyces sp. NPDC091385]|uniref:hypothetical protein n=1 Tax=Streptomyces sp. NPDC091385 TaxID=3365997 RepID=UPI00381D270A
MGFTSAWSISAHEDAFITELVPCLGPLIEAEETEPGARERWERWQTSGVDDDLVHLVTGGGHVQRLYRGLTDDDPFCVMDDVWGQEGVEERLFFSAFSKDWAVRGLFQAVGPARAALLPGWCGNFVLTSAEVRDTLPRIEEALSCGPLEKADADRRSGLDYLPDEESVLDGPLRMWRLAAQARIGLCGVSLVLD